MQEKEIHFIKERKRVSTLVSNGTESLTSLNIYPNLTKIAASCCWYHVSEHTLDTKHFKIVLLNLGKAPISL